MKVYVDTNILVDLVCSREPFVEQAQVLFYNACIGRFSLIASALSLVNTMYIGRKYGFSPTETAEALSRVAKIMDFVDLKGNVATWALTAGWKDYEDATQYKTAAIEMAECIVTRNKKDFALSHIPVYSIEELLNTIS